MSVDRPTFHESWHRVADVRPRLRASVSISRQHFRGQRWHVLEDAATGQFFRLDDAGYEIVGRLDGRCTIDRAWRIGMKRMGDDALTQGETVALLGQLSQSNLLHADVPGDVKAMLTRQRERHAREFRGYLQSLLFLRIPLLDPDWLLNRWRPTLSWLFTPVGLVLWTLLLFAGGIHLIGRGDELLDGTQGVLSLANIPLLYLTYAAIKLLHEIGHGVACKAFAHRSGHAGEVHAMGIMLLIFIPIPYVDASSSWALRSRLHRIVVSGAGIVVELACAAIAAIVWSKTSEGTTVHAIAYNAMFVAGVSTVLFNGNPLLRYDGYYIFSDLLGIPNLSKRSIDTLKWALKKYLWGVRQPHFPPNDRGEAWLLGLYGVSSLAYRVVVYVGIALFIASQQFLLGLGVLVLGVVIWVVVPLIQLVQHLATHHELSRCRIRAIATTAGLAVLVLVPGLVVPVPDRVRATGIAEPMSYRTVYADVAGKVVHVTSSGTAVNDPNTLLVEMQSNRVERDLAVLGAEVTRLRAVRTLAFREDPARVGPLDRQLEAVERQLERADRDSDLLLVLAAQTGEWVCPDGEDLVGGYVARGTPIGMVIDRSKMYARVAVGQRSSGLVIDEGREHVELRPRARPDILLTGTIERIGAASNERLPSASLGFAGGGDVATRADDPEGLQSSEGIFDVWIELPPDHGLLPGQRVVAMFSLEPKPPLIQLYRTVRQVLQDRFLL